MSSIRKFSSRRFSTIRRVILTAKMFWQFGLAVLALWIAMTRIADYFHHP